MPDITELLASAARDDGNALDLALVERRAVTLRRRQRTARSAAAAGVALVAAVLFRGAGAGPEALEQVPANRGPGPVPATTTGPAPAMPQSRVGGGVSAAPNVAPSTSSTTPVSRGAEPMTSSTPAHGSRVLPRSSPTATDTTFPPAASCSASATGLLHGQSRSCSFTATGAGGYRFTSGVGVFAGYENRYAADVWVTRGSTTTRYDAFRSGAGCADQVIQPGDRVTVTVRQSDHEGEYMDFELSAGVAKGCS